jgi:hypothetical protein
MIGSHVYKSLMFSHAHVSAYVDGRVADWAEGRAKQVYELYTVTKIEGAA